MNLYIAGGCSEHGRNSFLLSDNGMSILIDCGIMNGAKMDTPQLSKEQIENISYVFITHSHQDHSGALGWLHENGFTGTVVMSKQTYVQISDKLNKTLFLEDIVLCNTTIELSGAIKLMWGKSGHCVGAVWYKFEWNRKKIIFSGDYCETSLTYCCDELRRNEADLAVIDCAYGLDSRTASENKAELLKVLKKRMAGGKDILLPVPKYGRGLDLVQLICDMGDKGVVLADKIVWEQISNKRQYSEWLKEGVLLSKCNVTQLIGDDIAQGVIYLLGDPQLKSQENRELAELLMKRNGHIILTGSVDKGSYSENLCCKGVADMYRYDVHQNLESVKRLTRQNTFKKVLLTHTQERFDHAKLPNNYIIAEKQNSIEI